MVQKYAYLLLIGFVAFFGAARAEDYPDRPITIVTPYPPGGGSDVLTRILAQALEDRLKERVLVKNVSGAGGTIGSAEVARAAPDGYTLLSHHIGIAVAPLLYKSLPFDTEKAFAPIGLWADTPMAVVSRPGFAPKDAKQLMEYIRKNPKKVNFASSGMGSATHLCAMEFASLSGGDVTMVQYRGGPPAYIDVMSGRVDLICDVTASNVAGQIRAGKLKGFVLTAHKRLPDLPGLPTAAEIGIPSLTVSAWYGLFAPAGTPQVIVDRLSKELQSITKDPKVAAAVAKLDTTLFGPKEATPEALAKKLSSEIKLWRPLVQKALKDAKE